MTDLEALTADQLRALHVRTRDDVVRRAIKRRLQQLEDQPPPPPPANEPQMKKAEYRARLLALRPPTTRPWWSLAQIAEALDRTTAELNTKEGK